MSARSEILAFRPGDVFQAKYRILNARESPTTDMAVPLGEGGSGVVYVAEQDLGTGIVVKRAVKFFVYRDDIAEMTQHQASGPISATQFQDELLNLSTFNHENILKIIEAGLAQRLDSLNVPFLVTEFIEGPTLKDIIDNKTLGELVEGDASYVVELIIQLCRGIIHLHSRGFYHCDIAPKNIFLKGKYPDLQLIVGDLGIGRSKKESDGQLVFIIGTKAYCPPNVRQVMHSEIPQSEFEKLQPAWDLYAVAQTALELVNTLAETVARRPWLAALRHRFEDVLATEGVTSAKLLAESVEWLRPVQHTMADVPELADSYPSHRRTLLPVDSVTTSHRIRQIANHPAVLRLGKLPQLVMASSIFPGAVHTRYEHSLGTYQAVRRYLLALLNDEKFLAVFSPEHIETCLVCGLLSSVTRFPFSTIVHEIKTGSGGLFGEFSRRSILNELMDSEVFRDHDDRTLSQVVSQYFPRVNRQQLDDLLMGDRKRLRAAPERFIHFVLNSSIDARVVDYLRRDSLHLGLSTGNEFDIGELLLHVVFDQGRLLLRSSGLSVVEEIISLRYWLFNRIYWNRPNRTLIAMIRHVLYTLAKKQGASFECDLRSRILNATENDLLMFLHKKATEAGEKGIEGICKLLQMPRQQRFEEVHQCNRGEDDAMSRQICNRLCEFSVPELEELQKQINETLVDEFHLDHDAVQILIDVPVERGSLKLGDDLNVLTHANTIVPLVRFSGIVSGVQRGFQEQLQRVRVFLNPETHAALKGAKLNRLAARIRTELETIV